MFHCYTTVKCQVLYWNYKATIFAMLFCKRNKMRPVTSRSIDLYRWVAISILKTKFKNIMFSKMKIHDWRKKIEWIRSWKVYQKGEKRNSSKVNTLKTKVRVNPFKFNSNNTHMKRIQINHFSVTYWKVLFSGYYR